MVWAIRHDARGRTAQRPCALSPQAVRLREYDATRVRMCGLSAVGRDPHAGTVRDRATGRRLRGGCRSAKRVPGIECGWIASESAAALRFAVRGARCAVRGPRPAACDERDVEILFAVGLVNAARDLTTSGRPLKGNVRPWFRTTPRWPLGRALMHRPLPLPARLRFRGDGPCPRWLERRCGCGKESDQGPARASHQRSPRGVRTKTGVARPSRSHGFAGRIVAHCHHCAGAGGRVIN